MIAQVSLDNSLLLAHIINVTLVAAWIGLAMAALMQLRSRGLGSNERAGWMAAIVFVPVLGALAFLVARPGASTIR